MVGIIGKDIISFDNMLEMGVKAVSYTHLDVYKRQIGSRPGCFPFAMEADIRLAE